MDSPTDDIQYAKDLGEVATEPSKKKKPARKKAETKASKVEKEEPLLTMPDVKETDYDTELLNYTTKLESELAAKKKKLKVQRKKFRELLHSLAKYIDTKGIDYKVVDEFIRGVRPQLSRNLDQEYESFYSSHKCLIVEPTSSSSHQNGHSQTTKATGTKRPKTVQKQGSPMSSTANPDTEIPALDLTHQDVSAQIPQLNVQQTSSQGQQKPAKETKPKVKKEKDSAKEVKKAEEAEKKPRKPRKPKDDPKEAINVVDLEDISPKANRSISKDFMAGLQDNGDASGVVIPKLNAGMDDVSKQAMQQSNDLDLNSLMNSYLMSGTGLNVLQGIPGLQGMGGMSGIPGLQNNYLTALQTYGALGGMGGENMDAILNKAVQELMKSLGQQGQGGHDNMDYYHQRGGYN